MIHFGIDVLQRNNFDVLRGKRVGLMTNPGAVNHQLISTYDVLRHAANVNLTALFAPEHGFIGAAADGERINTEIDPRTGIPVYSLYGDSLRPTAAMLAEVDVVVCDIQDIGVRYYTFLWTVTHIVEACGEHSVEVVILDRPNPLGDIIAGSPLLPEYAAQLSERARFVGRYNVPVQHGMTLGEIVTMLNAEENNGRTQLTIIPCEGWQRSMRWDAIGFPFVSPSPNIPHFVTVQHYPGACLIEGTTLSEGRGTTLPFEVVGAPYIEPVILAEHLNGLALAGVRFRPHIFRPSLSKYTGEMCGGVQAHITDANAYQPLETWLHIIREIRHLYPQQFSWLPAHQGVMHFDRLIGSEIPRQQIDSGANITDINAAWHENCLQFRERRQPFLRYE